MSNYILPFCVDVITYPCPNLNAGLLVRNVLVKGPLGRLAKPALS